MLLLNRRETPSDIHDKRSQSLAQIVAVAFSCAATVYKRAPKSAAACDAEILSQLSEHRRPHAAGVVFTEREYVGPSQGGTEKALGVWMAESEASCEELPALVIAVRGTARLVDAMVNANGRPVPAADFLVLDLSKPSLGTCLPANIRKQGTDRVPSLRNTAADISAHAGFLNSAAALCASIGRHLSKAHKEQPGLHVIFTGHSAGGAVASLLYLKCLLEAAEACKLPSPEAWKPTFI